MDNKGSQKTYISIQYYVSLFHQDLLVTPQLHRKMIGNEVNEKQNSNTQKEYNNKRNNNKIN